MGTKLFQVEVHEDAPEVIIDLFKAELKDVVSLYERRMWIWKNYPKIMNGESFPREWDER